MGDFQDEHSGKGGSYVAGEDGKRVLQERTGQAEPVAQQNQPEVTAKTKQPKAKGVSNA